MDLSELTVENAHFVDEELKEHQSDALFSLKRKGGGDCKLYLLFEHKSHPDKEVLLQLLRYMTRIHTEQKPPAPVIGVVFHHGPEDWEIPENFQDLFDFDEGEQAIFGSYALNFRYILSDVKGMDWQGLDVSLAVRTFLAALRDIWEFTSADILRRFFIEHREVFYDTERVDFVEKLLVYIYRVRDMPPQELRTLLSETISEEKAEMALTTVGRLEKEAEERGMVKSIRGLLNQGVAWNTITAATGVTLEEYERFQAALSGVR